MISLDIWGVWSIQTKRGALNLSPRHQRWLRYALWDKNIFHKYTQNIGSVIKLSIKNTYEFHLSQKCYCIHLPGAGEGVLSKPYPFTVGESCGMSSFPSGPTLPCLNWTKIMIHQLHYSLINTFLSREQIVGQASQVCGKLRFKQNQSNTTLCLISRFSHMIVL